MRFEDLTYLAWAHARMGRVRYDLAASGARPVSERALGPVRLDDPDAPDVLRDRLADWLGVPSDEVLPTLGTSQALWLACVARVWPGDVVLVEEPHYEPLGKVPAGVGARVMPIGRPAEAGYALDVDRLEERVAQTQARLVLLSSPHNPSGRDDPDAVLERAAEVCAAAGATLLVDEVYRPFLSGRTRTLRAVGGSIWTVGSFTKRYGLGWARVGWLTGPANEVPDVWAGIRHSVGQNGTAFAGLGLAALGRLDAIAHEALPASWLEEGRALVERWVARHDDRVRWTAPTAGPFGLVHVVGAGDLQPRIEQLAEDAGVLVSPGAFFGEPEAFRVAWTSPPDVVAEGLTRLDALLD